MRTLARCTRVELDDDEDEKGDPLVRVTFEGLVIVDPYDDDDSVCVFTTDRADAKNWVPGQEYALTVAPLNEEELKIAEWLRAPAKKKSEKTE